MNLWLRLPEPLDAAALLGRAQKEGVSFLPARYFAVSRQDPGGLRLSFAGLSPAEIRAGLSILGAHRCRRTGRRRPRRRARPGHGLKFETVLIGRYRTKCFSFPASSSG